MNDAQRIAKLRLDEIEGTLATLHELMTQTDPEKCGWPEAAQLAYVATELHRIEDFWGQTGEEYAE